MEEQLKTVEASKKLITVTPTFLVAVGLALLLLAGGIGFTAGMKTGQSVSQAQPTPLPHPPVTPPWAHSQTMPSVTPLPPNARPGSSSKAPASYPTTSEQAAVPPPITPQPTIDVYTYYDWRWYTSKALGVKFIWPSIRNFASPRPQIEENIGSNDKAIWIKYTEDAHLFEISKFTSKDKLLAAYPLFEMPADPPQTTFHGYPATFYPAFFGTPQHPIQDAYNSYVVKVSRTAYYVINYAPADFRDTLQGLSNGDDYYYPTIATQKILDSLTFLNTQ